MKETDLELRKQTSAFFKKIEQLTKPDHCLLCGKENVSICNSHIVPKFILKCIASEGKVSYGPSLYNLANDFFETTKGVNNAFTFHLICRDCDKKMFSSYESEESILSFDTLPNDKKNRVLTEMALKSHLAHIYSKAKSLNLRREMYPLELEMRYRFGLPTAFDIDIKEHFQYIKSLTNRGKRSSFTFDILYNELLDYQVGLASQTIIAYQYDLTGKQIFDPHDFSTVNFTKYFYLMILPCNGKTRILFYIERKYVNLVQPIISQFNKLSPEEKLHFLFVSLIIYDEQFYMNPKLQQKIKKDKSLVKLYSTTDPDWGNSDSCKKIKDFRKYKNYLINPL